MLPCDRPEKAKKIYRIPRQSKKRLKAIADGSFKPAPRKAINKRSERRAQQETLYYSKTMPEYKKKYPICQYCGLKRTAHVHHRRGRIEELLNDTDFFIGLCEDCHHEAEIRPNWAKDEGISVMRTN